MFYAMNKRPSFYHLFCTPLFFFSSAECQHTRFMKTKDQLRKRRLHGLLLPVVKAASQLFLTNLSNSLKSADPFP